MKCILKMYSDFIVKLYENDIVQVIFVVQNLQIYFFDVSVENNDKRYEGWRSLYIVEKY